MKYYMYSFTLSEESYNDYKEAVLKEYSVDLSDEEQLAYGYAHWHGMKVSDVNKDNPDYTLDDFPFGLPFEKIIEDDINDLAGIRIICFDIAQIYKIAYIIGKQENFEIKKVKDYVRKPKENGYQSYHIQMKVDGVKVEIQLRTILMDAWSSLDSILVYKKEEKISNDVKIIIDSIKDKANFLIVKASPMIDITQTIKYIDGISVKNLDSG